MRIHAQFPTRTIGNDPGEIRAWAEAVEDLGFACIEVPDHVFGAAPRGGWTPTYSAEEPFHETFATIGFLAACTKTVELSSGVLILPQRQTGVVAKQAAQCDILSGGRLRLGIGVGWNHVEYEALETDWKTRGAKQAEQVEVLRMLWTEELVTFKGRFHDLKAVNIMPGPVRRSIPIWFGGSSDPVIRRAARIGDGWMPMMPPNETAAAKLETLRGHLKDFGRDAGAFGLEAWLRADAMDPDAWGRDAEKWKALGVETVMLYPMFRPDGLDGHIEILKRFKEATGG